MTKIGDTFYLKDAEKSNLPTSSDPTESSLVAMPGDKYFVVDTFEVGVFLDGEWNTKGE